MSPLHWNRVVFNFASDVKMKSTNILALIARWMKLYVSREGKQMRYHLMHIKKQPSNIQSLSIEFINIIAQDLQLFTQIGECYIFDTQNQEA